MARGLWYVVIVLLLALPVAAVPLIGLWAFGLSGAILLLLVMCLLIGQRGASWYGWAAMALGIAGGLVATASALFALVAAGDLAGGGARIGFGWLALALAVGSGVGGALARVHPRVAVAALVTASPLGTVAMSMLDINTIYGAAIPLCWWAALLASMQRPGATTLPPAAERMPPSLPIR